MAKEKKKKSREEKLAQQRLHKKEKYQEIKQRLHKKEKYQEIKNDPEKYAIQKEKERLRYLKRKEQKKLKSIKDLTPRQQRQQRKKWKENRQRYVEKKKQARAVQQMLVDNSPPTSDEEDTRSVRNEPLRDSKVDPLEGPSSSFIEEKIPKNGEQKMIDKCVNCIKKDRYIRKIRYNYGKQIGVMKKEIEKHMKEKAALKKYLERTIKRNEKLRKLIPSTEQKVESLISNVDEDKKKQVKKKLLFGEVMTRQLKKGFESLKKKDKRKFSDIIVVDKESLKKHKLLSETNSFTVRNRKEVETEDKVENEKYQEIIDFYEEDSNSRIAADKKEWIKRNGIIKQKRYLNDSLLNLHKIYNATHTNQVSYSTFCKNRPFWIVYPKESDRNTCMCIVHVNMDLLIKCLNQSKIIKETNGSSLLRSLCCDVRKENCLNRRCNICKNKVIEYAEFKNDKPLKYYQWGRKTEKYTVHGQEKSTIKTTKMELNDLPLVLIKKLEDSLPKYFQHSLNIVQQYKNINDLKKSLTSNEILIHMDFSENYMTKFHEEVQSRHFGSSPEQISLHTSVVYYLDIETGIQKTFSMCTMSECTRHDAESVEAHIMPIIEHAKSILFVDTLHFLTDSPSSQYRNRKIFYLISQLQHYYPDLKSITWNYMECGHGKGAPDGIGAVIKRTADSTVRFGRDIGTLEDFWRVMKEKIRSVEMRLVTRKDIEDRNTPDKISSFKGTMSVHQVLWSSNSLRMTFRKLSCFFCPNGIECNHGYHLGFMDVPEEKVTCEQEQLLQEFIDTNTTPELLDEITNSPKRADNAFETVLKETTEQAYVGSVKESNLVSNEVNQGISHSRKVTILSDVRLDLSNTVFYGKQASNKINPSFQSNFEKFIKPTGTETTLHEFSQNKEKTKSTCRGNSIEEKKTMEESKENVQSSDDDLDIF